MFAIDKDPGATLDYTISWADWLVNTDVITASTWTVETGVTKVTDAFTTTTATIWLSGGTHGEEYTVVNRITTQGGRIDERSLIIRVGER
jgi:hypothetical protein